VHTFSFPIRSQEKSSLSSTRHCNPTILICSEPARDWHKPARRDRAPASQSSSQTHCPAERSQWKRLAIILLAGLPLCLAIAGCSSYTKLNGANTSTQPTVAVSISPNSATLLPGQQLQLTATVIGTSNELVSWEVNGVEGGNSVIGTISPSGIYLAPATVPTGGSVNIDAVSVTDASISATASITVNQGIPVITWANPASIPYGTALGATQLNAASSTPGTLTYTPAAGATLSAGTHQLSVSFTPIDNTDDATITATASITVNQGTPVITWANPASIPYGTAFGATQLNATASVPGAFAYTPALGTVLNAGSHVLSVTFTPTDNTDSTTATATASINVNQATPVITWANPAAITYGTALSATQLNATSSTPGTITYTPAAGTTLTAGTHQLSVTFTPTDTTDYLSATGTVSITVNPATPVVTWANPAAITYGSVLSAAQLNATESAPGTFVYTPAAGTTLTAGTHLLSVTFMPTDTTDYAKVTATASITVSQATPVITWANPPTITYGTVLSATQLNATASAPGTFNYTPAAGTTLTAETHQLFVSLTPTDSTDYLGATATASIIVIQGTATVSWSNPTSISYGTPLSATQLNATASIPGIFTYTPAAGTTLGAGTHQLSVSFIPTDNTDYAIIAATASITITDVVTISPTSASVAIETTSQFAFTVNGSANSSVTWSVNGVAGGNASIGTITSSGLYQAPPAVPASTVTVGAVDPTDNLAPVTASVTVFDPAIVAAHSEWLAGVAAAAATYGCENPLIEQQSTESVDAAISRFGLAANEGNCLVLSPVSTVAGSLRYSIAWGGTVNSKDILYISDVSQMRVWNGAAVTSTAENTSMISKSSQAATAESITLSPGSNIQSAVNDAPEGTTFFLLPGVYRMQSVAPKEGDAFVGQGAVDLDGADLLSFSVDSAGSGMWVATAPLITSGPFPCQTSSPLCDQPQDLFIDNVLQQPATTESGLTAGSWYFNRSARKVYLPADPTGHIVEIGAESYAFYGAATGVQISNLTVEKYATHAQQGAIGNIKENSGWTVDSVEVRWNHGAGVELGDSGTLSHSFIHHNGQLGIALSGVNCQAIDNEDSWNNYAGFVASWEAGGSKFYATTNLLVQGNYVHDNNGPGLWTDYENVGTVYTGNTVINNLNEGIKHEVSYGSTISNNTVMGNGNTNTVWLWYAQIELQNSSDGEIYGNTVEVPSGGGNGIALINQNRGSGNLGTFVAANDHVHDNTVTYIGANGYSGIVDDTGGSTAVGNSFDSNRYILQAGSKSSHIWVWFSAVDWSGFQGAGQEPNGTCCN